VNLIYVTFAYIIILTVSGMTNGSDGFHGPVYIEEGYCRLTGRYSDPLDVCD